MRAALYIDCGSIKVEDIPYIYEEIRKTDDLVISKMFGVEMKDASEIAGRLRIRNNLHCGGDQTSALVALAVEVMADAIDEDVQKTYIATGDLAVLPLLDKLKLMRTSVVVIGPCGADRALIDNSEKYTYLEVINGGECTAEIPSVDEIAGRIYSVSSYYNGMGEDVKLEQVYKSLIRRYPDFDVRNYGYTHLSTFVKKNVSGVQVVNDDCGGSGIKIVDDRKNIDDFAYEYVAGRGYTIDDMAELIDALREKFPGFAMENYGYHGLWFYIELFKIPDMGEQGHKDEEEL